MADGYLTFDTKMNTTGFKSGMGAITGMFTKLAAAAGVALSVAALVNFGKAGVKAASEMQAKFKGLEFLLKANGRSVSEATGFIQEYIADGLVPMTSAYEAYKNMVSRGYETDQIEKMMNAMKDAAVYNRQGQFTMGEAIEKATMGLRMENSLLTDSVGIQKNVAKMWAEYAKEIGTVATNLTDAQKRQAEFSGFMKEGGVFAGAAAEYTNSYAGRVSTLSASMLNLKIAVGNAVIPIINALLPLLKSVVDWLTRAFNLIGQSINLLFGTNVGAADAEALAKNAQSAADATGELAANTEAAGEAAKGSLAAFDKLNVLAQPEGATGGATGGAVTPGVATPLADHGEQPYPPSEMSAAEERIARFISKVRQFLAPLLEAWGRLSKAVKEVGKIIGEVLAPIFGDGTFFDKFITALRDGVIVFIDLATKAIKALGQWIKENPDTFRFLVGAFVLFGAVVLATVAPIVLVIAAIIAVIAAIGRLSQNWDVVSAKLIEGWQAIQDGAATVVNKILEGWQSIKDGAAEIVNNIIAFFVDGWNTLQAKEDELKQNINDAWQAIQDKIAEVINAVVKWFVDGWNKLQAKEDELKQNINDAWQSIKDKAAEVINAIKNWFRQAWKDIKGFFSDAWTNIQNTWNGAPDWFQTTVIDPIKNWVDTQWDAISAKVTGVWEDIKAAWNGAAEWFNTTIWQPIKDKAGEVWESIKTGAVNIGVNVANGVVSAVNGVIGFINSMINGLEDAINGLIDLVNRLPLINIPNIDLPNIGYLEKIPPQNIPYLATGAVIPPNAPFQAMLGDHKSQTEILAPEDMIRRIVREESGRSNNTEGGLIHNVIKLDGQVLYDAFKKIDKRVGSSMLAGSGVR